MSRPVVVDTMVASSWLGARQTLTQARWAPVLDSTSWVLPFVVVAEIQFGAEVAEWGRRRRSALDRLVWSATVVPPLDEITRAYVDLRTWCVRAGHGLGAKHHEADRWIGAVALAAQLPLASDDAIFRGIPGLVLLTPLDGT